ncbi:hypothetical protein FACS189468_2940 [Spirochaetia bacterium]|nr:hypothetical protein FACS189468_2940 [Spirochaetia bacterium]
MKHKIPCFCDNTFVVEVPEEIDLDADPQFVDDIMAGRFMNFTCAGCGKIHKPEFPLTVLWPSKNLRLEVIPEPDRGSFYRRKNDNPPGETIISYPEMADRIAVIRDGLEPLVIEAIKYYLLVKAEETYPEEDVSVWYQSRGPENIELHLHGIKKDEAAVTKIPLEIYERTRADFKKNPKAEPFASLRFRSYLSVQNILRPEELK